MFPTERDPANIFAWPDAIMRYIEASVFPLRLMDDIGSDGPS
jgi:hypothetical protein